MTNTEDMEAFERAADAAIKQANVCTFCLRVPVLIDVYVPAHLSSTGQPKRTVKPIDACLASAVAELNADESPLIVGSCCGHGEGAISIDLVNGETIEIDTPRDPAELATTIRSKIRELMSRDSERLARLLPGVESLPVDT